MMTKFGNGAETVTKICNAAETVEDYLRVDKFIENHKEKIFAKLEENFGRVKDQPQAHLMFVALCLPLVSGVIHVGSTLQDFNHASDWIKQTLGDVDPVAILSTFTLVYIVKKGLKEFSGSNDRNRKQLWEDMYDAIQTLLHV